MTIDQKLDAILQNQSFIRANQAYLEHVLFALANHVFTTGESEIVFQSAIKSAEALRKKVIDG